MRGLSIIGAGANIIGAGARNAERTPLPYEMRSLGYPQCRKNGGHDAGGQDFHYNGGMEYAARLLVFDLDGTLVDSKGISRTP